MSDNMSTYQQGFAGGLNVRGTNVTVDHPGKVFWVGGGDATTNLAAFPNRKGASDTARDGGKFLSPFKTLDFAVGQCVANRGDIVFVLPGYVDVLSAADAIDVDVAGVSIIGLGTGAMQPRIGFDNTAATFAIDAVNVTVEGLNFRAEVAACVKGVDVKSGADDFVLRNNRFTALTVGTHEFNDAVFVLTSDRGVVEGNYFDQDEGAAQSAVHWSTACLGLTIQNNYVAGDYAVACLEDEGTASEQILIKENTLINGVHGGLNALECIQLVAGTTGSIEDNNLYCNVAAGAAIVSAGTFRMNNTHSATADSAPLETSASAGWQTIDDASNPLGIDDSNNVYDSGNVTANEDGSVLERLERLQEAVNVGTGTALGANTSLLDNIVGSGTSGLSASLGKYVATSAIDLYDGMTTVVYTVAGGQVLVTSFTIETTVGALDATAAATKFTANPTVGVDTDMCATLDVTADPVGTIHGITGIPGDAMIGAGAGTAQGMTTKGIVVNTGTIDCISAADSNLGNSALQTVRLTYIPITPGATVTTAL